jgi:DNA-binding transcriptional MerR regulator
MDDRGSASGSGEKMRIAELSSRSGTTIPTIKYYLREGLLAPGAVTGRNQADYAEQHVHRLRLIRALIDVGGLSVAAAKDVLAALDSAQLPDLALLGTTQHALVRAVGRDRGSLTWRAARDEVVALVRDNGWRVEDDSPNLDQAADAVAAMRALDQADLLDCLPVYFAAAQQLAAKEVDAVLRRRDPAQMVEGVVTGTILGEALFGAVRRLAHEHTSITLLDER